MANKIANNIVKLRKKEKFNTTLDLSNIIIA
jgi:16S rRNA C1402 N4-methylase RsmH